MFARFDITQQENKRVRLCSASCFFVLLIYFIGVVVVFLLSVGQTTFFQENQKGLTKIEVDYRNPPNITVLNKGKEEDAEAYSNSNWYFNLNWQTREDRKVLYIKNEISSLDKAETLKVRHVLNFKEKDIFNLSFEDFLELEISNAIKGQTYAFYCQLAVKQNYIMNTNKIPKTIRVKESSEIDRGYSNSLPFRVFYHCSKTVSSNKNNKLIVTVSVLKPDIIKVFYSVNIFRILREKWKKIFAIGFIVIYFTNKLVTYFSQNGIIELF